MLSLTELKKGTLIQLNGKPYQVIDYQHTQLGRSGAIVKTKIKSLIDGSVIAQTFKGNDKVEPAALARVDVQYLYRSGDQVMLMDQTTYDQVSIPANAVTEQLNWISEGAEVIALKYKNQIVGLELPSQVSLTITKAEPGARGDTTGTALKPARLETGAEIQVPLFIKPGDRVIVDTRTGSYVGRS